MQFPKSAVKTYSNPRLGGNILAAGIELEPPDHKSAALTTQLPVLGYSGPVNITL